MSGLIWGWVRVGMCAHQGHLLTLASGLWWVGWLGLVADLAGGGWWGQWLALALRTESSVAFVVRCVDGCGHWCLCRTVFPRSCGPVFDCESFGLVLASFLSVGNSTMVVVRVQGLVTLTLRLPYLDGISASSP